MRWHSLAGHSADVAAVVERLLSPESVLAARLAETAGLRDLTEPQRAWLVRLACLHDVGKVNRRFQAKKDYPRRTYVPRGGHVKVVIESDLGGPPSYKQPFGSVLRAFAKGLHENDSVRLEWFRTIVAHHGRPWGPPVLEKDSLWRECWKPGGGLDSPEQVKHLLRLSSRWSKAGPGTLIKGGMPSSPAFTHLFAGTLTLADWIGSTEAIFELRGKAADDDPDGYWDYARTQAAKACAEIGVVPRTRPVHVDLCGLPLLKGLFPALFSDKADRSARPKPTSLQEAAATMKLPPPGSSMLVESETGSGKTEAVLTLYARMRAADRVGGLFFALPTRATARAMHDRVMKTLPGIYPEGPRPAVALAVGGLSPRFEAKGAAGASEKELWKRPDTYDDDLAAEPNTLLARWAASGAKKFLAAEIVVGTVDQALLAGLPVRHAHLRLAALARHLVVVDELHSYDRYISAVLANLLEMHTGAGGCAAFMSATLSASTREELEGRQGASSLEEAICAPYPALWVRPRGGVWHPHTLHEGAPREKPIRWDVCDFDTALADAVAAAEAGARVCILRNTVAGARQTVKTLQAAGAGRLLWRPIETDHYPSYHSRYTLPDRKVIDDAVIHGFGPEGTASGVILVSTQVVEQSLDVDFDFFITDLCPIDALLQRLGRLHRHAARDYARPGGYQKGQARAKVIAPDEGFLQWARGESEYTRRGPNGWGSVYEDLGDLELTLRLLRQRRNVVIPRENRALIEAVYHADSRLKLEQDADWGAYVIDADGRRVAQERFARDVALCFDRPYTDVEVVRQFDAGYEGRIRTRLGDDTVRVSLAPHAVPGWYSSEVVDYVDLPSYVVASKEDGSLLEPSEIESGEMGIRFRLGERTVRYDSDGWHWDNTPIGGGSAPHS